MTAPMPLILDVDTGMDDALALAYAVASPVIELVAVTTVAGNVNVELATANTLRVLDWLGAAQVPVHRGASRPLTRTHRDASYFHGASGLGAADLPASRRDVGPDRGPAAIIRLARGRPGEITLVCVGPLTNLAIALNVEPNLPELLKSIVLMGGAYHVPGNVTAFAEFNIFVDPEAAAQVFATRFASLTAVGLDVTLQVALPSQDWDAIVCAVEPDPAADILRGIGKQTFQLLGRNEFPLHDPLATMVAVNPDLVRTEDVAVGVALDEPECGRTKVGGPGDVKVATAVDAAAALEEFRRTVGLPTATT